MNKSQIRQQLEELCNVRDRIKLQGFAANEEYAKQYLILPMIKSLGYKTDGFPPEVHPEYPTDISFSDKKKHCVDYAVCIQSDGGLSKDNPCIFAEAKSLAVKIDESVDQLASYFACKESVQLGILTNGCDYRLFIKERGETSRMEKNPILAFSIDELLYNDDKLEWLLKFAHKESMLKRLGGSGKSLLQESEEQAERAKLFDFAHKLLASDSKLDTEFIKYMATKAGISVKKFTENAVNAYEPKVREALNRTVKKIQTDYLALVEKSRNNNTDDAGAGANTPDISQAAAAELPDAQERAYGAAEKASQIVTTEIEFRVLEKLQAIIDASDLPKNVWSKSLNQYIPTQIKYKDSVHYINFFIDERSQEEINNLRLKAQVSAPIRYTGQYKIEKGQFYFLTDTPEELQELLPSGFEILPPSGKPASANKYPSICVHSFDDIGKLAPIFVRCFKKAIDAFIANNPTS